MKITDISPVVLKDVSDQELLGLHRRLHQLWGRIFEGNRKETLDGLTREDVINAHRFVVEGMVDRDMKHNSPLKGSRSALGLPGSVEMPRQIMVVPQFVSLVGSRAMSDDGGDVDILLRTEADDGKMILWGDNVHLPLRKVLDPGKDGYLHFIANPQGPHAESVPLYDLVMLRSGASRLAPEVTIDLGCGRNKAHGCIGVDSRAYPGVDVVYNLELGLPFVDGYADGIRAHHVLEHLANPQLVMLEIWRVLKPGGILDVAIPSTTGEGAFAHPDHASWWNKSSFAFYCQDELREEIGFVGKFEILWLEEIERGEAVDVRGRLRAVKEDVSVSLAASPWYKGPLPKPSVKMYTEFFSTDELWDKWARQRVGAGLAVENKLNGIRALVQVKGDEVRIEFEDTRRDVSERFPGVVETLKKYGDVILDCSLGVEQDGKPWPRIKLMTLTTSEPDIPEAARVVFTAFDVLYDGVDVTGLPLSERRERLESVVKKIGDEHVDVSEQKVVKSKLALEKAAEELAGLPGSEGVVVKEWDAVYPVSKATSSWSKVKSAVEVLAWVLDAKRNKGGTYNFRGGLLLGDAGYKNVRRFKDEDVVDLGYSFNAAFSAKRGDVVSFEVEEIILQKNGELAWLGAKPISKEAREKPYFAKQVVGLAERGHILQDARQEKLAIGEEGETRSAKATAFWQEHWHESFPKSGEGEFVYQHHWRGLSEDEAKAGEKALLDTKHSVHGDLRCSFGDALWGFSVFLGKVADLRGGRDLGDLPADDALGGAFKLHQPKAWLTVAREKPFIVEPGGPGSTSKTWSAFFEIDRGRYQIGVWREHFFEIFLRGKQLKGRYMIQYAQQGKRRYWQIAKPEDQTPYAERHGKEAIIEELSGKHQRWLVWAKPGQRPELIDIKRRK